MQFRIQSSMVVNARLETRSKLQQFWDRLRAIERIPLYRNVLVVFSPRPSSMTSPLLKNTRILLANGTTWIIQNVVSQVEFTAVSTDPLTSETLQQMQDYLGDAVVYDLESPDQEPSLNRHYV